MDEVTKKNLLFYLAIGAAGALAWFIMRSRPKQIEGNEVATVTGIRVYPIKGCGGINLVEGTIGHLGFLYDRQWVLVRNDNARFITQRQFPSMALISLSYDETHLLINAPDMQTLRILKDGSDVVNPVKRMVGIWDDEVLGQDEGDKAGEWFSTYLKSDIRMMRFVGTREIEDERRGPQSDCDNKVSYSDQYSFLLASENSLQDLQNNLTNNTKLDMRRFRPNIIISGPSPFAEVHWKKISIGEADFYCVKNCSRCKVTTVDQDQGKFGGDEPLKTIQNKYNGNFGENLQHTRESQGKIVKVGMKVYLHN